MSKKGIEGIRRMQRSRLFYFDRSGGIKTIGGVRMNIL